MLNNSRYWSAVLLLIFHAAAAQAENLYQPEQFKALVSDKKAYKVGDNLTVQVFEDASSTTSAATTSDKSSGVDFKVKGNNTDTSGNLALSDQAQGKGKIQRSGKLLAQITVTVKAVDPSGLLVVSGEQLITVNEEKQEIKLEGKVRPADIGENNTVLSSRLADAKISYIGEGILGDRQRPGLITRFLNWLGLV